MHEANKDEVSVRRIVPGRRDISRRDPRRETGDYSFGPDSTGEPSAAIARHHADAWRLQDIERIFDLAQAAFDVRHRNKTELRKPLRMILHHASAELVAGASLRSILLKRHIGPDRARGCGDHGLGDAILPHLPR